MAPDEVIRAKLVDEPNKLRTTAPPLTESISSKSERVLARRGTNARGLIRCLSCLLSAMGNEEIGGNQNRRKSYHVRELRNT